MACAFDRMRRVNEQYVVRTMECLRNGKTNMNLFYSSVKSHMSGTTLGNRGTYGQRLVMNRYGSLLCYAVAGSSQLSTCSNKTKLYLPEPMPWVSVTNVRRPAGKTPCILAGDKHSPPARCSSHYQRPKYILACRMNQVRVTATTTKSGRVTGSDNQVF